MAEHPRPSPSPRPAFPPDLEVEEPTNPKMKALKKQLINTRVIVGIFTGAFSAISLTAILLTARTLRAEARDAGADGAKEVVNDVEAVKRAVTVIDADLQQHKADDAQAKRELLEEVHGFRGELRELYKSGRTGDRSPVLEKPVPPLPPPPPPQPPRAPLFPKDGGR